MVVIRLVLVVRVARVVMMAVTVDQIAMAVLVVMIDGSTMGVRTFLAMGVRTFVAMGVRQQPHRARGSEGDDHRQENRRVEPTATHREGLYRASA